jgi:hypothetical protein
MKIVPMVLTFTDKDHDDMMAELRKRITTFHLARRTKTLPMKHVGEWCKYCPFRKLCQNDVSPFEIELIK